MLKIKGINYTNVFFKIFCRLYKRILIAYLKHSCSFTVSVCNDKNYILMYLLPAQEYLLGIKMYIKIK